MARKNIFELLNSEFNISREMNKILQMLNTKLINYSDGFFDENYTIEELFNLKIIPNWKQRGLYLSNIEIKTRLKIPQKFYKDTPFDDILNALEYCVNLIHLINTKLDKGYSACSNLFELLIQNINSILEQISYQEIIFEEEEKVILIPKNPAATAVAEISSEDTALAIFMYHHASLKGNLQRKRELLLKIYLENENLFKRGIDGFSEFFDKTRGLVNKLGIKHNNTKEINNIDDKELEKWYDELYQLLLFCILIPDNLKRKQEAEDFLKTLKGVKS